MKKKIKCRVCGFRFEADKGMKYEVIINPLQVIECFDCFKCGCQNVVNLRQKAPNKAGQTKNL